MQMTKGKKLLSILLALALCLSLLPTMALANAPEWEGDGSSGNPYKISSDTDLRLLATRVNGGNTFESTYFEVTNDITLSGSWTPIGNGGRSGANITGNRFMGIFDGGGKTISGLSFTDTAVLTDAQADGKTAGLFGATENATIKNFTLASPNVSTGYNSTGAVVGLMKGGTVSDVTVTDATVQSAQAAGGIVGRMMGSGEIKNCTVGGTVNATWKSAGGIAGTVYRGAGTGLKFTDCTNNAAVTSANDCAGGVVGFGRVYATGCTNNGEITSDGNPGTGALDGSTSNSGDAGGIVGRMVGGTVSGCKNTGTISGVQFIAGIVGGADHGSLGENDTDDMTITGNTNSGTVSSTGTYKANIVAYCSARTGRTVSASANNVEIDSADKLVFLATEVNAGNTFAGDTVKLTDNINLSSIADWTPIGTGVDANINGGNGAPQATNYKYFAGTFDGNSKTVSGLAITTANTYNGLFGALNGATVKDLTVSGMTLNNADADFIGAVAGYTYNSAVTNSDVTGTVSVNGKHFVGGALGFAASTTVNDCDVTATGTVKATDSAGEDGDDVGGLAGYTINSSLQNCTVNSTNLTVSALRQGGGLVGLLSAGTAVSGCAVNGVTVECAATDTAVTKKGGNLSKFCFGGFAGAMHSGNISVNNSSVSNVMLTLASGAGLSNDNKAGMRIGKVTGGTYTGATFAVTIDSQTGKNITVNNVTRPDGTKSVDTPHILIDGPEKQPTPTAYFIATDADKGTLGGVTEGMMYSTDGGTTWTAVAGTSVELTGVTAGEDIIQVYKLGDDTTLNSDPQKITVTQAAKPTNVSATDCTTSANSDGKITGVTSTMEYQADGAESWTPVTGEEVTGLAPGTYNVRVAAKDAQLASENAAVTIRGKAATPVIDPAGGTYTTSADVTITCATEGAKIYYTTDGTEPTVNSTEYTGKLTLTENATVKAIAVKTGMVDSQTAAAEFTINYVVTLEESDNGTVTIQADGKEILSGAGDYTVAKDTEITLTAAAENGYHFVEWQINGTRSADLVGPVEQTFTVTSDVVIKAVFEKDSGGGSIGGGGGAPTYTPTIEESAHGKITAEPRAAAEGEKVKLTATPDEGYELDTLTVKDADGKEVPLTKNADGTYTYVQPKGKVTITGTFKVKEKIPFTNPFVDVHEGDYFYEPVMWAVQNGVTKGTDEAHFSPNNLCTRAETVTFLWRAEGSPEPNTTVSPFEDVSASAYYYKAVLWAVENGVTKGTDETHFSPDAPTTREQYATFLYRIAQSHGKGFTGMWSFRLDFPDAGDVSDWAYEAMCWMVMNGVVNGMDGRLNPQGNAVRAHVVSMLYRYQNLA